MRKSEEQPVSDPDESLERLRMVAREIIALPKSELEKRLAAHPRRKRKFGLKKQHA